MRTSRTTLQSGACLVALALSIALAGCATVPRSDPGGAGGVGRGEGALRFAPADPEDAEGFTEAAYRELIAELDQATARLADEGDALSPEVRADLLLHMAVAYQGLAQYERVLDQERYDTAMRACLDRGRDDCRERVQPDFSRSDELEETARACVSMLKRIRAHQRAEEMREKLQTR